MALFGKKSGGDAKEFKRDLRKARRFFEHAETTADARNYDYSIECYVNGLRHDPDNIEKHEALLEVSKRRKVSGGKPAGFAEKMKSGGSSAIDKMLHQEKLWAMDMLNCKYMADMMKWAVEANEDDESGELHLDEVAYWVGEQLLEYNTQQKQDPKLYRMACDLFQEIGAYDKAVIACKHMLRIAQTDALRMELKNLEAASYSMESSQSDDFRSNIKDADKQRELELEDASVRTESAIDELIAKRRSEYEEDPQDDDRKMKLIDTLLRKESMETESEAIGMLEQSWEESGQYRLKLRVGDIKIKQMNRKLREIRKALKANPKDAALLAKYKEVRKKQLVFELKEFDERVKNYPTDLAMKYELGRRQHQAGMFDEAIGTFQQAKQEPKHRAMSHYYLGDCYLRRDWLDEAIDTLKGGLEAHRFQTTEFRWTCVTC